MAKKKKAAKRKPAKRKAAKRKKTRKRPKSVSRAPKRKGPRSKGGKPMFVPTDDDRKRVETLAGLGIKIEDIRYMVENPRTGKPIDDDTLRRHFKAELSSGRPKAHAAISQSLFKKATGDGHQSVAAAIWWTKTQMGWREKVAVEVEAKSGVLVAPTSMSPEEWIAATAARAAGKKEPGTEESS